MLRGFFFLDELKLVKNNEIFDNISKQKVYIVNYNNATIFISFLYNLCIIEFFFGCKYNKK